MKVYILMASYDNSDDDLVTEIINVYSNPSKVEEEHDRFISKMKALASIPCPVDECSDNWSSDDWKKWNKWNYLTHDARNFDSCFVKEMEVIE